MIIDALVIAPYKGLTELTASLKDELSDFRITMLQADLSEVLPLVATIEEGQYDVIISRGGTARLLRRHVHIPVIDIQVSGYDMMRIITLVKGSPSSVVMIGFPNIIDGFVAVSRLMDIEIPYTVIEHEDEAGYALARAREAGAGTVLGDTVTVRKAQEYGLEGVLITSGKESVLEAFAQAKYMQVFAERYQNKCLFYEQILDGLDTGFAVFNGNMQFQFANDAFCKHWDIPREKLLRGELLQRNPSVAGLLDCVKRGVEFEQVVAVCEPLQSVLVSAGPYLSVSAAGLYAMKTDTDISPNNGLKVTFSSGEILSYPLLMPLDSTLDVTLTGASNTGGSNSGRPFPIALYGETGTGKRLWSFTRTVGEKQDKEQLFVEVELLKSGNQPVEGLKSILQNMDSSVVLYFKGIENTEPQYQKPLTAWIGGAQARVILSFTRSPAALMEDGSLEPGLYTLIKDNVLFFPPLRDRRGDLEALIRSFIAKANEMTGKQVAGLRPTVWNKLLDMPWTYNFTELKETVDFLVQAATGEFIDDSAMELLERKQLRRSAETEGAGSSRGINLNQTLEKIERDVIEAVMAEEHMNQSKVAKRLGINRSTLWRKLKQTEG